MAGHDPIVISDSDSDTLSESERPAITSPSQSRPKATSGKRQSQEGENKTATAAAPVIASGASSQTEPESVLTAAGPSASGLLGLLPDRRQIELERKQRARKRRREQNLPSSSSEDEGKNAEVKRSKTHAAIREDVKLRLPSSLPALAQSQTSKPSVASSSSKAQQSPSVHESSYSKATDPITPSSRFWSGTIKHSFNRYASPSLAGVSISQMLLPATASSRNNLQFAVLATYDLRIDWLYSLFPRGLPVTLVVPPPKEDYRTDPAVARPGLHPSEIFDGFSRCPGWQICVPHKPKGGWLTQHMKFLMLVHEGFLRVAILSGNLNEIDWERIENTAFIQDFPLLTDAPNVAESSSSGVNDFQPQLIRVLRSLSLPASHPIYSALDRHDFSLATRARIVASWPEASSLAEWDRIETQGPGRLGKVVRDLGIRGPVEAEFQGSSLANHDIRWVEHFHLLASGVNPRGLLPIKGKPNESHSEYARAVGGRLGELPKVKICFPSQRYVEERTVEGAMGALSFFGKAETWDSSSIKSLYHSPQSRRGDVMIHAKSILALTPHGASLVDRAFVDASDAYISGRSSLPQPKTDNWKPKPDEQPIGWTYLGSANFTRAAHGNIGGTAAKPTLSSSNWELGVVLPVYASEVEQYGVQAEGLRAVVYHRPLQAYAREDRPWDNASARALL